MSPKLIKEHYYLPEYPHFLEFYLKSEARGSKVMSEVLPALLILLNDQGIGKIAAVSDRENPAARRVLIKSGFVEGGVFDVTKNLFYFVDERHQATDHSLISDGQYAD